MVILLLNKQKKEWKIITEGEKIKLPEEAKNKTLTLPAELIKRLDFALREQKKDDDVLGIISGEEGSGKSALAGNIMRYITFDEFDPKTQMIGSDYLKALTIIEEAPQQSALMFDEGNAFFMATETMRREHRDLSKIFSMFRQKRLFVIICLPSFLRLGTYFAIDRSNFLIRTYKKEGQRGFFAYHGPRLKAKLYREGKKNNYNIHAVRPRFTGRFHKCKVLESSEYKDFKLKTLRDEFKKARGEPEDKPKTPIEIQREHIRDLIKKNPDKTNKEISDFLGISVRWVQKIKAKTIKDALEHQNSEDKGDISL